MGWFISFSFAAAVSEPEASERGSSLIGKKLHYRGIQSLFLTKRKELWLCATQRFGMRNGLARNCGYHLLLSSYHLLFTKDTEVSPL